MADNENTLTGLPVAGYREQSKGNVDLVNDFKRDEERILRKLDAMRAAPGQPSEIDQRWLAHGRTLLEDAFMAINRSVFRPGRVTLPEDDEPRAPSLEYDPSGTNDRAHHIKKLEEHAYHIQMKLVDGHAHAQRFLDRAQEIRAKMQC